MKCTTTTSFSISKYKNRISFAAAAANEIIDAIHKKNNQHQDYKTSRAAEALLPCNASGTTATQDAALCMALHNKLEINVEAHKKWIMMHRKNGLLQNIEF